MLVPAAQTAEEPVSLEEEQNEVAAVSCCSSPALLQSTVNMFFWPIKAFDRPAPLEMALLASEENLGKEAKAPPIADDLVTVSTRTEDVSWRLWPPDSRGPAQT